MGEDPQEFKVSLGGNLPGEQANGWNDQRLLERLFGDRATVRWAVVAYNVNNVVEKTADGTKRVVLQVLRVEPVEDGGVDEENLRMLLTRRFEDRTGQGALFLDDGPPPAGVAGNDEE